MRLTLRTCRVDEDGSGTSENRRTDLIPVVLWKINSGCTSLDSRAIDQNVDFVARHDLECFFKNTSDLIKVIQISVHELDGLVGSLFNKTGQRDSFGEKERHTIGHKGFEGVVSFEIGLGARHRIALNEAHGSARFDER